MAKNPHFFAIIVFPLQLRRLQIPDEVIPKYGNILGDRVELRVPYDDESWHVELLKNDDGKVWLGKGWSEFTTRYCVSPGHLLVFEYDNNRNNSCCFQVLIFDTSATEIEYGKNRRRDVPDDDVNVIEINDDSDDESQEEDVVEVGEDYRAACRKSKRGKRRIRRCRPRCNPVRAAFLRKRANPRPPFKSQNPHFFVHMSPSYVQNYYYLYVPARHSQEYLKDSNVNNEKKVSLQTTTKDGEMRTWIVDYKCVHMVTKCNRARFVCGWKEFAIDNELRPGDVCIFELINRATKLYRVIVHRFDDHSERSVSEQEYSKKKKRPRTESVPPPLLPYEGQTRTVVANKRSRVVGKKKILSSHNRVMRMAKAFQSNNPHFTIYIHPSYVGGSAGVRIPQSHSKIYLINGQGGGSHDDDGVIILHLSGHYSESEGQTVRLLLEKFRDLVFVKLGKGWLQFVKKNDVKVGDACIFELVDVQARVYAVTIIRGGK